MDSISTARNFFINQQGLSPDQADMLVSKGMEAYNQQMQPQSMMQMASGGRIGYGFGNLVKASGVVEPVSGGDTSSGGFGGMGLMGRLIQQNPEMFRTIQASSSRRDFIDENGDGVDDRQQAAYGGRIGYQMGGSPVGVQTMPMDYGQSLQVNNQGQGQSPLMSEMPNYSSAKSITMNPLLNYGQSPLADAGGTPLTMRSGGIARLGYQSGGVTIPSQGSELSQMNQMDPQQALQTIIKILIENGIPPEEAQQLALQIIQIFAQGGTPAVEAFANQLEQQEAQAMASGGIAGYAYRQGYGLGSIVKGVTGAISGAVKGVANAVKSVASSTIGRAALTIAAATFLGPGAFGIQGLGLSGVGLGLATAGANLGLQALGGRKLNLLEAGLSGLSAGLGTPGTPEANAANITIDGTNAATSNAAANLQNVGIGNPTYSGLEADISSMVAKPTLPSGAPNYAYTPDLATIKPEAGLTTTNAQVYNPGVETKPGIFQSLQDKVSNVLSNPIDTLKSVATSAYDYAKENPLTTALGVSSLATLGAQLGVPRNEGESDESYAKRLQETQGYITNYGRNLKITNPYFYQREGAVNPFAPTMAANGGIMGYKRGGSMVPPARQIEGGILELDARKSGGYIPYGKKERVDDVPAMLAKDEFVFTSKAVKAAGGGDARRGAAKMYALMKQLESKGARA